MPPSTADPVSSIKLEVKEEMDAVEVVIAYREREDGELRELYSMSPPVEASLERLQSTR